MDFGHDNNKQCGKLWGEEINNPFGKPQAEDMKGLDEFAPVPNTPPPQERKDKSLTNLENELNQERSYLDALSKENKDLERIIANLDKELAYIKSNFPQNIDEGVIRADNELWFKYQAQREVNRKLEKEKKHLEGEIKQIEEQGVVNLDSLTQSELILYVKQLERSKTDLTSELRAAEWSLDKQAKDSHHLLQQRTALDAEIRHYDEELAMFRHYNKTSCPSATSRSSLQVSALRGDVNFSSLDEGSKRRNRTMSPTPGFQRRTAKGAIAENQRIIDPKKGPINKKQGIGSLPSLKSKRPTSGTPAIVVTDTTNKSTSEPQLSLKSPVEIPITPLQLQSVRNFENSPPPKLSAGFSFDEEAVRGPVAEVPNGGEVTVRLDCGRSLIIQVHVVEEKGQCSNCKNNEFNKK